MIPKCPDCKAVLISVFYQFEDSKEGLKKIDVEDFGYCEMCNKMYRIEVEELV